MKKSLNVVWEVQKEDKSYSFVVPYGSTYADAYEVLQSIANDIQADEKIAIEKAQQKESTEVAAEVVNAVD